jgi:RNA polymerase sigma factor (sigma-70 family)
MSPMPSLAGSDGSPQLHRGSSAGRHRRVESGGTRWWTGHPSQLSASRKLSLVELSSQSTDEELLAASASGDEQAFAVFFDRHIAGITAFFHRRVSEPEVAFDLAGETFAAVVVGLARFDQARGPATGWLYGIARNKLLESMRRGRVEASARLKLALDPQTLDDEDLRRVEELASVGQSSVTDLLDTLPADQRDAVHARVIEERSYSEIAGSLGCSEMVVRQRVHRGLVGLRAHLEEP